MCRCDPNERWHCAVVPEPALLPRQPLHLLRVHSTDDLPERPVWLSLPADHRQVGVRLHSGPLPRHDLHVPQPRHWRPRLQRCQRQARLPREHHVHRPGTPAGGHGFIKLPIPQDSPGCSMCPCSVGHCHACLCLLGHRVKSMLQLVEDAVVCSAIQSV